MSSCASPKSDPVRADPNRIVLIGSTPEGVKIYSVFHEGWYVGSVAVTEDGKGVSFGK